MPERWIPSSGLSGRSHWRAFHRTRGRALLPALLNNGAWDLHDMGRPDEALPLFVEARTAWKERGGAPQIRAVRWAIAHCLRSLGRHAVGRLGVVRELH